MLLVMRLVFFFKQRTAYEMRISDWSSDVCSSDLDRPLPAPQPAGEDRGPPARTDGHGDRRAAWQRLPRRHARTAGRMGRSEERRVGEVWVSTFRSRLPPLIEKKNIKGYTSYKF